MTQIIRDRFWIINLRKYFFDLLCEEPEILAKIPKKNIVFYEFWAFKDKQNMLIIHNAWSSVSPYGVRDENYQVDIFAPTLEEVEEIKNILVSKLNRKKENWIFIQLESVAPDLETPKKGYLRRILVFRFVVHDRNF